jgi:hypothetical protein
MGFHPTFENLRKNEKKAPQSWEHVRIVDLVHSNQYPQTQASKQKTFFIVFGRYIVAQE